MRNNLLQATEMLNISYKYILYYKYVKIVHSSQYNDKYYYNDNNICSKINFTIDKRCDFCKESYRHG